ncbi:MAG: MFS transporter [Bryobacterales bacterium]|jgi:MFS transporter, ACS family, hexuronate transporter|nr:MFS transporter [Bryobacterales bacterium]
MLLVSLISYVDRNTLALLAPTILRETSLTAEQYGWVISAFSVMYMIGNPVWGRLLDKLGLRLGMNLAVSVWTVASAVHAATTGFWSLAVARGVLGFGEGATFPGGLRAVTQTLPPALQARGMAVAYSGGSMGAILTPILMTPVALLWGWRGAFLFTGLIGVAWLTLWFFVSRREDVRRPVEPPGEAPGIRLRDPRLWGFIAAYSLGAMPIGFVLYSASLYLNRVLGASQADIGKVLWIPPLGWETGYFFWGWLLDKMVARGVERTAAVRRLMFAGVLLSLPLACVTYVTSLEATMALLFLAMFVTVGFVVPPVSHGVAIYTTANAGLIAGIGAGSFGASVAIFMPLFGRMFDQSRWSEAFLIAALLPAVGFLIWSFVNRRTRV